MSTALFYLCKASITLAILYLVFWLFLRKDTFHQLKRFVLLANLLISLVIPLLPLLSLNLFWDSSSHPAQSITELHFNHSILTSPQVTPALPEYVETGINMAGFIYLAGVLILLVKFSIRLFSVYTHIHNAKVVRQDSFTLAVSDKVNSPFSFFRYLILSPDRYQPDMLSHILAHEQVHITEKHTIDRLLSEVYTIFFWFNPFAWLHQRLLVLNLEYIADQAVLNKGFSIEQYQFHLLKLTLPDPHFELANNFNQSGLLKRIHMMNKPASSLRNLLKIALLLPVLSGLLALFNGTQAKKAESILQALTHSKQSPTSTQMIQAQARTITGVIKDADTDKPLSGVLIQVKGKPTSTQSDASGKFSINVSENDKALVFQLEYFNAVEMAITSQSEMIVLLKFTDRKVYPSVMTYFSDSTYIVKPKEILEKSWDSSWKYNGWSIDIERSQDALPNDVLYLIDGKEIDKATLNTIDKNSIESITVYKDRISLRKYNAEDKRGVVEIQLKQ